MVRIFIIFIFTFFTFNEIYEIHLNYSYGKVKEMKLKGEEFFERTPTHFPWDAKYYLWVSESEHNRLYLNIKTEEIQKSILYDFSIIEVVRDDDNNDDNDKIASIKHFSCLIKKVYDLFSCTSLEDSQLNPITLWTENSKLNNKEKFIFIEGLSVSGGNRENVYTFKKYKKK